jgi:hypothetical protein
MTEQGPLPLNEHIQETDVIQITNSETPQVSPTGGASAPSVDYSLKDCETLYGAAMETAHCLIGTRKEGVGHRELPEERRKLQGKMLYNICKKYDNENRTGTEGRTGTGTTRRSTRGNTMKADRTTESYESSRREMETLFRQIVISSIHKERT